jgi:sulfate transport system substrate-binding protein
LFTRIPVLDTGGRGATTTFSQKGIGDVHLTFENEARLEAQEAGGSLEIVYPTISILAEPYVTLVDSNVDRHGTRQVAEEYLRFLYTHNGQEIIARHFLRPSDPDVLARHAEQFPRLELVPITAIASGWEAALQRFFAEGAMFDQIFERKKANGRDR